MSITYHKPVSVAEVLAYLASEKTRLPVLAGGTALLVEQRTGSDSPKGYIDISRIAELKDVKVEGTTIEIGSMVTHSRIISNDVVRDKLPALAIACGTIGGRQIQNMGTIGGNVMNASPAGDTMPALIAYGAQFIAKSLKGERVIEADDFFTGYKDTALAPEELLARIRIPLPSEEEVARFYKVGARGAHAISKVSMCIRSRVSHGGIEWIRIAVGSVAPTVIRLKGTEALLRNKVITKSLIDKARRSLADEVAPIDDIRSTADYRKYAAVGLLMRYLREITKKP